MDSDGVFIMCVFLAIILFTGEPALMDAIIKNLMN